MALQPFLALVAGIKTVVFPVDATTGASDAGKIVALNAAGSIDGTMLPAADQKLLTSSEAISAGMIVNVHDDTGAKVRMADASGGVAKAGVGFVLDAVADATPVVVRFEGIVSGLSGLTIGARYYLSATAGQITPTPPDTATHIVQYIGRGLSATELAFEPADPIVLA